MTRDKSVPGITPHTPPSVATKPYACLLTAAHLGLTSMESNTDASDSHSSSNDMTSPTSSPPEENAPFHVSTIGEAVAAAAANDGDGEGDIEGLDQITGSLCMACGGEGTTKMLTTKIPFFREVILSSFECDTCHWRNNEVCGFVRDDNSTCAVEAQRRWCVTADHQWGNALLERDISRVSVHPDFL